MIGRLLAAASIAAGLAACGAGNATPTPTVEPVVVTFEVDGDERFRALIIDPATIDIARRLLAGQDAPGIPTSRIVHSTGVNTGYTWSLDPADLSFIDETDESCDGSPSDVEDGSLTGDRYCPSSAVVVAIDPLPAGPTPSASGA